jgi:hypothetical protein
MPFVITAILSGAIGLIRGGRLDNLAQLSIRWPGLVLIALGLQILVVYGPGKSDARSFGFSALLLLGSYALLFVVVLANRHLPGMVVLGLGAALNFLVILVNGGWMPVTAEHLAAAGFVSSPAAVTPGERVLFSKDVVLDSQAINLPWLSDVFLIPNVGLFSAVFSVGDALMMLGLFVLVQFGMFNEAA